MSAINARCPNVVGPVWKLDGESWACELPAGHAGEHEADGTWWAPDVGNVLPPHSGSTPGSDRAETEAGQTGSASRDTGRNRVSDD